MDGIVTQKDIALSTGLNQSTVSLALKDDPRVNQKTRELVLRKARELGYRKDPMLSALASYRDSLQQKNFHGTLAWIVDPEVYGLDDFKDSVWSQYLTGAQSQAIKYGYKLETFEVDLREHDQHRLSDILYHRGIEGVILPPLLKPGPAIQLDWQHFVPVTFGWSIMTPRFYSICPNHYYNGSEIVRNLHSLGYKRIGAILDMAPEEKKRLNCQLWAQGVEVTIGIHGHQAPIETLKISASNSDRKEQLIQWYRQYQPDAIAIMLECVDFVRETLSEIGVSAPEHIGIAGFACRGVTRHYSGIDENTRSIGEAAVDVLVASIQRRNFGIPRLRRMLQIEGVWQKGNTVRSQR